MNTTDLGPQEVLLLAEIERVSDNISLQVATETDLDLAGGLEILGFKVGQSSPRALALISHEIGILIDTGATGFTAFRPLILRQILGLKDLTNVIVFAGT